MNKRTPEQKALARSKWRTNINYTKSEKIDYLLIGLQPSIFCREAVILEDWWFFRQQCPGWDYTLVDIFVDSSSNGAKDPSNNILFGQCSASLDS
ncbi:hypothetical protein ERO13_A06G172002v2 [Gossypium hirsutum]|uniref:Uncharacterized protein n=2 Tax=Gossypium TaxID=3633 RepID=A0A5D2Q7B5_GOSTO|nr:hypothetical protein ERO13_A06G172002v2 [Gossypium hirsutum]TYH14349.1 hypothetical protein ES288_A06G213300v1 [Gossypium darwinii]TYI24073.1 hypothetical protein ES332_A06G208300v1 [Gossypium tomentosum]